MNVFSLRIDVFKHLVENLNLSLRARTAIHKFTFEISNIMTHAKFFLDTNVLVYLSGLKDWDLQDFKTRIETSNSELSATHIQVDEIVDEKYEKKLRNYQQKIEKALESLKSKGIKVRLEATKIPVAGILRTGHFMTASQEVGKLYDELRKEIDGCERAKETIKPVLNIACDAVIAVSSLGHDFLITTDECLFVSWVNVIGKYQMLGQQFRVPKIIYAHRSPKLVAKQVLGLLS